MRIPSNRVESIIKFFREELKDKYDASEIENFIYYSFEHYLGFKRSDLVIKKDETVNQSDLLKLNFVVKDLKKYRPIQYILGEAWFYGNRFFVDRNVLIPRPETEELVKWILDENGAGVLKVADIGTGSGCIPVTLKLNRPQWNVSAFDISEDAISVAERNAGALGAEVSFSRLDILNEIPEETFDIVVSNPPYVPLSDLSRMDPNVVVYEPHLALFVENDDPLIFYKRILSIPDLAGKYYFELHEDLGDLMKKAAETAGFKIELRKDINEKIRMARIWKS